MNNNEPRQTEKRSQTELYRDILACFKYGRANAVHLKELELLTGLNSRALRLIIERIRRDGNTICADENGYYLPETIAELEKYIHRAEAMAKSTFYTLRTARKELEKMRNAGYEQISIDEIGQGGE